MRGYAYYAITVLLISGIYGLGVARGVERTNKKIIAMTAFKNAGSLDCTQFNKTFRVDHSWALRDNELVKGSERVSLFSCVPYNPLKDSMLIKNLNDSRGNNNETH